MRETPAPDEHLVSLSKDGSLEAFNTLVGVYERQVYNLCLRLIGDRESAEDAAQETFLAAFRGIRGFRGGSFRSWLLRIAANQAKDELRRRQRRPQFVAAVAGEEVDMVDPAPGPEDQLANRELAEVLAGALHHLPFEQRQLVLLVDYLGLDYEEAAAASGSSLGTVKSRLHRGRDTLRRFVMAHPELFGDLRRPDR